MDFWLIFVYLKLKYYSTKNKNKKLYQIPIDLTKISLDIATQQSSRNNLIWKRYQNKKAQIYHTPNEKPKTNQINTIFRSK